MKKLLASLAVIGIASTAHACPTLDGQWVSNHDLTMAFAEKHAKLEERTIRFLDQMMGRLTMQFDGTRVNYSLPDWDAEINGERHHLVGFHETSSYQVLFCNGSVVAVKGRQPVTEKDVVTVYNFADNDTMWVYQDSQDNGLTDLNIREYFVRVK